MQNNIQYKAYMKDKDNNCIHWLTTQTEPRLKDGGVDDYPAVYVCHYDKVIDGKHFMSAAIDFECKVDSKTESTPQQMAHCWASNKIYRYKGISDIRALNVYMPEFKDHIWVDYVEIISSDKIIQMTIEHMLEWHEETDFSKPRQDVLASLPDQYYKCVCHEVR